MKTVIAILDDAKSDLCEAQDRLSWLDEAQRSESACFKAEALRHVKTAHDRLLKAAGLIEVNLCK